MESEVSGAATLRPVVRRALRELREFVPVHAQTPVVRRHMYAMAKQGLVEPAGKVGGWARTATGRVAIGLPAERPAARVPSELRAVTSAAYPDRWAVIAVDAAGHPIYTALDGATTLAAQRTLVEGERGVPGNAGDIAELRAMTGRD
jgi:hypothetical protein